LKKVLGLENREVKAKRKEHAIEGSLLTCLLEDAEKRFGRIFEARTFKGNRLVGVSYKSPSICFGL
jgi:hypothetical protein